MKGRSMQSQPKIKEIVYRLKSYQRILKREYTSVLDEVPKQPTQPEYNQQNKQNSTWKEKYDV